MATRVYATGNYQPQIGGNEYVDSAGRGYILKDGILKAFGGWGHNPGGAEFDDIPAGQFQITDQNSVASDPYASPEPGNSDVWSRGVDSQGRPIYAKLDRGGNTLYSSYNWDTHSWENPQQSQAGGGLVDNFLRYAIPAAGAAIGLGAAGAFGPGAAGASTGSSAGAGTTAAAGGAESFVGPATGTVESAPVIAANAAPTISGVASGGGPFVSTALIGPQLAQTLSSVLPASAAGAVQSLVQSGGTMGDLAKLLGAIAPAALGYLGAKDQADAFSRLSDKYSSYGAPYRDRLAALYENPNSFLSSNEVQAPIQQAANINARALSTTGNPIGSGNAMQAMNDFTATKLFSRLGEEKDRLGALGGISTANSVAPSLATSAINSNAGALNAVGAGFSNVFNPPPTLAQTMADFKRLSGAGV